MQTNDGKTYVKARVVRSENDAVQSCSRVHALM